VDLETSWGLKQFARKNQYTRPTPRLRSRVEKGRGEGRGGNPLLDRSIKEQIFFPRGSVKGDDSDKLRERATWEEKGGKGTAPKERKEAERIFGTRGEGD